MTPIFVPPQPVQIVRQRIQNQAAIQEQLRAYDREQQAAMNANDVRFNANNIGRKTTLYPEPSLAAGLAAKQRRQEAQEEESKQRAAEAEERREAEEAEFQRKQELSRKPVDPVTMGLPQPPRKRGRPAGTKGTRKLKEDLKKDILSSGTGSLPENFDDLYLSSLQDLAQERGISIVYE